MWLSLEKYKVKCWLLSLCKTNIYSTLTYIAKAPLIVCEIWINNKHFMQCDINLLLFCFPFSLMLCTVQMILTAVETGEILHLLKVNLNLTNFINHNVSLCRKIPGEKIREIIQWLWFVWNSNLYNINHFILMMPSTYLINYPQKSTTIPQLHLHFSVL